MTRRAAAGGIDEKKPGETLLFAGRAFAGRPRAGKMGKKHGAVHLRCLPQRAFLG